MSKALDVNDKTAKPQPKAKPQSGGAADQEKLEGKAFQVNDNSVEEGEPVVSPTPQRRG